MEVSKRFMLEQLESLLTEAQAETIAAAQTGDDFPDIGLMQRVRLSVLEPFVGAQNPEFELFTRFGGSSLSLNVEVSFLAMVGVIVDFWAKYLLDQRRDEPNGIPEVIPPMEIAEALRLGAVLLSG